MDGPSQLDLLLIRDVAEISQLLSSRWMFNHPVEVAVAVSQEHVAE